MELDQRVHRQNCKNLIIRWIFHGELFLILKNMTLKEAEALAFKILKQVMEEKLTSVNVQLAVVTKEKGYHTYSEAELQAVIESL